MKYVLGPIVIGWGFVLVTNFRHWVQIMHRASQIFAERSRSGGQLNRLGLFTSFAIVGVIPYPVFRGVTACMGLLFIAGGSLYVASLSGLVGRPVHAAADHRAAETDRPTILPVSDPGWPRPGCLDGGPSVVEPNPALPTG